ncbi:helix-turn-helix domain-containing protein [Chryseobacterium sp. ISL-6]|uniref:helix-turn-helix domain-containing protein n=1 Tax=Chryseobacterium sp. ISL-6 TaxID=2819143 RepID=UPI001BEAD6B4|nr:helix-turn-helix domain-containing protein [Chryseobacterium sp. ISL-6]MBT2623167.1 AraC family transcriptional regulator [Chryseobacterium sp. ISL-6]
MKQTIPTFSLNSISKHGFIVEKITDRISSPDDNLMDKGIHRDSHYIFMFLQTGYAKMMVDFKVIEAENTNIYCLLPGQVHQGLLMDKVCGWFVAVNVDLVPDFIRSVFEESIMDFNPLPLNSICAGKFHDFAQLLYNSYTEEMLSTKEGFFITKSLLNAYTGMFASFFLNENKPERLKESRAWQLTRQFRILVRKEFITLKSPSLYAELLNISPGYLNEAVSKTTGKSTLYWIQQEILVEAKRLLFFTNCTVKEIAYQLGYNDHTYFSRLFSKLEGITPLSFRGKSRKQIPSP